MPSGPPDRRESPDPGERPDPGESIDRNPRLAPDAHDRRSASGLSGRLNELPSTHPSSADYGSDRQQARAADDSADHDRADHDRADHDRADHDRADDSAGYCSADDIQVSDRLTHILDGDETGGGHRPGADRPGKTEFPVDWSDDRILDAVVSVARDPDEPPQRQNWNDRWQVTGDRDGVKIFAVVEADGRVWTAWPDEGSPGVVKNAVKDN